MQGGFLPHGVYSLFPSVLTTIGWLSSVFQDGCDFAKLTGDLVGQIASTPDATYLEVGFKAFREPLSDGTARYLGPCTAYPDELVNQDTLWTTAKGFAFFAQVLGLSSALFLWFSTCCVFSKGTWHLASVQIALAAVCQACSFIWFQTEMCEENSCDLFWGSKTDIVATVFWTLAAAMMCCKYPEPQLDAADMDGDGLERTNPRVSTIPSSESDEGITDSPVRRRDKHRSSTQPSTSHIAAGQTSSPHNLSVEDENDII